jgi:hypothetical protein
MQSQCSIEVVFHAKPANAQAPNMASTHTISANLHRNDSIAELQEALSK